MRKSFITRVAGACASLTALLGLPAAPVDAAVFAGVCATEARLVGTSLTLTGTCAVVPTVTASLTALGSLVPVLPVGVCSTGLYASDAYMTDTTTADEFGQLQVLNVGTLQVAFVSNDGKMAYLGELAPTGLSGTCPSVWNGVLVIENTG